MSSGADLSAYVKFVHLAESRTRIVEIAAIVLLVMTWLALALRFFVRTIMIMNVGWDDAMMLATNVCCARVHAGTFAKHKPGRLYCLLLFYSAWLPDWR